jgi:hypothetical protein
MTRFRQWLAAPEGVLVWLALLVQAYCEHSVKPEIHFRFACWVDGAVIQSCDQYRTDRRTGRANDASVIRGSALGEAAEAHGRYEVECLDATPPPMPPVRPKNRFAASLGSDLVVIDL